MQTSLHMCTLSDLGDGEIVLFCRNSNSLTQTEVLTLTSIIYMRKTDLNFIQLHKHTSEILA